MKTHIVSNQNFTAGNICFVNRHFVTKPFDMISNYIPQQLGESLNAALKKVEKKDFDIFVARSRQNVDFFEIKAGKDYFDKKNKTILIHQDKLKSMFINVVDEAVKIYENTKI